MNSGKPVERRFRLARLWSNEELRRFSPLFSGRSIVNVSGGDDEDKEGRCYREYFPESEYWISNYNPGGYRGFKGRANEFVLDLLRPTPREKVRAFDVVFNHTVLEHVYEVGTAFKNVCALSRDVVVLVVPFAQVHHETSGYEDFWRFTPTCLRRLFDEQELTIVYESANNDFNAAVYLFFVASRYPGYWKERVPSWKPVDQAGAWIGEKESVWLKVARKLRDRRKKCG